MTIQTGSPDHAGPATASRRAQRVQSFVERGWPVLLAMTIIGALLGGYYGAQRSDNYVARSTIFVSLDTAGSGTDINQGAAFIQSQMPSYAELVHTQLVLQPVAEELGVEGGTDALRTRVEVNHPPETALLTVSAYDPSSEQAVRIANRVVEELQAAIVEAADPGGDNVVRVDVDVVDEPSVVADQPSGVADARGDETEQLALVFAVGGAVLGLLLLAVAAMFDRRLRGEQDVKELTDAPVLAMPDARRGSAMSHDVLSIARGAAAVDGGPFTWVVLPAGPEADPHMVARHLVASLSSLGGDVMVLDATTADVVKPPASAGPPSVETLDRLAGEQETSGSGSSLLRESANRTVLTAARLAELGWDLRRPDHLEELTRAATKRADALVLVLGPLGVSKGAPALAARAEAAILATRRDRTRLADLNSAIGHLRVAGTRLIAVAVER